MTSQTTFTSCMHDQMLESNKDDVKLEAMRCVTVMTAKGKLSVPRTLFPHIVKNVSSKNPELKKLIYLYLTNFADQEPDLALLPVATLQKSLKSPNPLMRSSALKILTSMRLNILSAILMATLRSSVNDLSPYVRKTVAHSIIKIYRLDSGLRPDLIEYIERLFNDKNSMVLSSAMAAYEVVCPEQLDLVQKHYKRFCFILADCNEWGQTLMLRILVRFILKTCTHTANGITSSREHDPKILLRSAKPLVHSDNSAVVIAVVRLFIAIANHNEVRSTITRPLIRLLYAHREIQLVVLKMIENLTSTGGNNNNDEDCAETQAEENSFKEPEKISESSDQNSAINESEPTIEEVNTPVQDVYISIDNGQLESKQQNGLETSEPKLASGYEGLDSENINCQGTDKNENITETKLQADNISVDGDEKQINSVNDEEGEENEDDDDDEEESESGSDEDEEEEDEDEDEDEETSEDESEDVSSQDELQVTTANNKSAIKDKSDTEESEKEDSQESKKDLGSDYIDLSGNKDPNAYREIFRPHIKSFYIKNNDCTLIRLAKLRILTNLSSSVNVSQILRELQAYISVYVEDTEFVSAAIHAIGRCAIIVKEVAHICLNVLTSLLSNNNEHIVSEAIVVLRSQIIDKKPDHKQSATTKDGQTEDGGVLLVDAKRESDDRSDGDSNHENSNDNDDKMVSTVIKQVTKLLPNVRAPQARGTILWILAEFCDKNITAAKCTPNVLRQIAKTFCDEDNFVKLQSLTLVSKFMLSLDKEKKQDLYEKINLLATYLFRLAKYDTDYDVRDEGRFLKKLLEDEKFATKVLDVKQSKEETPEAQEAA